MDNSHKIHLSIDTQELREIYFLNNQQKVFFGPSTKKQSLYFLIGLIIFPFFIYYSLGLEDRWIFILGFVFFGLLAYDFWKVAKPVLDWKKSVEEFLERVKHLKELSIEYNEDFILHKQDNQEQKTSWNQFEKAIITDRFIWLVSSSTILVPRKSMSEADFLHFTETVKRNVTNYEKDG